MHNLLQFLLRYGHFLTFLLLEFICFYLIVQFNQGQRDIFFYSSNLLTGSIYERYDNFERYLSLNEINEELREEHAELIALIGAVHSDSTLDSPKVYDHHVIPARVINNSISGRNNFITLNKGKADGVAKSMGLLHPNGVVGIVKKTTLNYSSAMSILNSQIRITAQLKRSGYFGNLSWDGNDPLVMQLSSIPKHASVAIGDTVCTSRFSSIFPENIPLGIVDDIQQPVGSGDFTLNVKLFIDVANIDHVYIVSHKDQNQLDSLKVLEE